MVNNSESVIINEQLVDEVGMKEGIWGFQDSPIFPFLAPFPGADGR